ncbi:hypothetical protein QYF36_004289 [Acer negundo]|nr:hypothetical protein QYF36_004289 [Acer negundo]
MSCSSSLDGFFFKKDRHKWSFRYELVDDEDSDDENEVIDREECSGVPMKKKLVTSQGSAEKIVTCFRCEKAQQHIYGIDAASEAAVSALDVSVEDHVQDLCAAPGTVTGVDIARHHLAACRTLPQKLHPGSSLSTSSVGCTDPTSTSISSTQCDRSANNGLGPCTSYLDSYKRDRTVNKNERKENLKGSPASSSTNMSIEVDSSDAETSSSKAGFEFAFSYENFTIFI